MKNKSAQVFLKKATFLGLVLFLFLAGAVGLVPMKAQARQLVPVVMQANEKSGPPHLSIHVQDENGPVPNAEVLVEDESGNVVARGKAAASGDFSMDFSDARAGAADKALNITAWAQGHGACSALSVTARQITLELPLRLQDKYAVVNGRVDGYSPTDDDAKAMIGLVGKAFELSDLAELDTSAFLSPLKDTIDVMGERRIPSNIVLPEQTFPIYFIPIHVNKPEYRLPIAAGSRARLFSITGFVDIQQAVEAIRGGDAWAVVNMIEPTLVGVSEEFSTPTGARPRLRLDLKSDKTISTAIKLKVGENQSDPKLGSKRLIVSVWEPQKSVYVPTAVQQTSKGEVQINTMGADHSRVLDLIVSSDGMHFRGTWIGAQDGADAGDASLGAALEVSQFDQPWAVASKDKSQLMVSHLETAKVNSLGTTRYEDQWVIVGPKRAEFRLPRSALNEIRTELGKISHVALDLIALRSGGYPMVNAGNSAQDLDCVEKIRKAL